jgi:DNA replication and repair protein RecF
MLSLRKITITHFKNYDLRSFLFNRDVIGICGLNGKGKTNLLDAIYYCCFTKSYFSATENLNIGFEKDGFRLEAHFENGTGPQKVVCIHRGNAKKEFYLNEAPYEKFSSHIGLLPLVIISPDDIEIITGSSEIRRKYLDIVLCQLDAEYLRQLMTYNKVLQQRNSALKQFAEHGRCDNSLLDILDMQLAAPGKYIYEKRVAFTRLLLPLADDFYRQIAPGNEEISIRYASKLHNDSFESLLARNRDKDMLLQRTQAGIHKDDLDFVWNGQLFRNVASQGQRKSLLFALKLAEYELIRQHKGFSPLLLLDDVFEKLDDIRMNNLLHWVCKENKGQVFITDTHKERLEEAFDKLGINGEIIELA